MDTTLSYLICLSCLPQIVHTSRERAVLNVMGQHTVDQDTAAGCCAGRLQCFVDACRSCGRHADKSGRRCLSTDASAWQDGRRGHLCDAFARSYSGKIQLVVVVVVVWSRMRID